MRTRDETLRRPNRASRPIAVDYQPSRFIAPPRIQSVLSGDDTEESDLDLLVEPGWLASLLTIAGLKIDAEKLLGGPVSVFIPNGLPAKFDNEALQRAKPL